MSGFALNVTEHSLFFAGMYISEMFELVVMKRFHSLQLIEAQLFGNCHPLFYVDDLCLF